MYTGVASRQVVVQPTDQFSQAVSMNGANALQVEAVVFHLGGTSIDFRAILQTGDDLENLTTESDSATISIGFFSRQQ